MPTFGEVLKKLRKSRKMSQADLADVLNKTQATIAYYEKNEKKPGPDVINKLADYFLVTTDYLLGRSDDPVQYSKEEMNFIKESQAVYSVDDLKKKYKLVTDDGKPLTDEEIEEVIRYVQFRRNTKS